MIEIERKKEEASLKTQITSNSAKYTTKLQIETKTP
jgi:hypothetical protein